MPAAGMTLPQVAGVGYPGGTPGVGALDPYGSQGYATGIGVSGGARVNIDGTPSRVAGLLIASGAVLAALKLLGFRFNVGVTS